MDLRIEKVVALMRDDLTQRLPLSKMAQLVNLSRARLRYLFKSESGTQRTSVTGLCKGCPSVFSPS